MFVWMSVASTDIAPFKVFVSKNPNLVTVERRIIPPLSRKQLLSLPIVESLSDSYE